MGSKTFGISNLMLFDSINKYNYINHKHIERWEIILPKPGEFGMLIQ